MIVGPLLESVFVDVQRKFNFSVLNIFIYTTLFQNIFTKKNTILYKHIRHFILMELFYFNEKICKH